MGRGIGNRQKKIVAPKKTWIKPPPPKAAPLARRKRDGVRGKLPPERKT